MPTNRNQIYLLIQRAHDFQDVALAARQVQQIDVFMPNGKQSWHAKENMSILFNNKL